MLKKQMKKFQTKLRKDKKMACAAITSVLLLCSAGAIALTHASSTITKYYNKAVTITLKDSNGYKQITKNGKKVAIKKGVKTKKVKCTAAGKYTIKTTNKKGLKKTIIVYIDKKKPVIKGVNNLGAYKGSATVTVTDNVKLDTVTVNGTKTDAKFTVSKAGSYTVVAKDMAGNKATSVFTVTNDEVTLDSGTMPNGPVVAQNTIAPTEPIASSSGIGTEQSSQPAVTSTVSVVNTEGPIATTRVIATPVITPEPTPIITIVTPEPDKSVVCTEHQWIKSDTSSTFDEATCTRTQVETYVCSVCGAEKKETTTKAEHDFQKLPNVKGCKISDATCKEPALYYYACSRCSQLSTETYAEGNALGHAYTEGYITGEQEQIVEEATCKHGTIYKKACKNEGCTEKYIEETWTADDQKAHEYTSQCKTDTYLKTGATCDKDAVYWYKCATCTKSAKDIASSATEEKYTYVAENSKTGHKWTSNECAESHAHVVKGKEGSCIVAPHYYQQCEYCKKFADDLGLTDEKYTYEGKLKDHKLVLDTTDANCIDRKGTCKQTYTYFKKCSEPGCPYIDKSESYDSGKYGEHSFVEKDPSLSHVYSPATCRSKAKVYKKCEHCNKYADEVGLAMPTLAYDYGNLGTHVFEDDSVRNPSVNKANDASCTEPERYYYKCTMCDTFSNTKTFITAKELGHKYTNNKYKQKEDATCSHGIIYYKSCERCHKLSSSTWEDTSSKKSHNFDDTSVHIFTKNGYKYATCTSPALFFKKCTMCDTFSTSTNHLFEYGNALGHTKTQETISAATAATDRTYKEVCSTCHATLSGVLTDVGSHTDKTGPEIYWNYTANDGNGTGYGYTSQNMAVCGSGPSTTSKKGTLTLKMRDTGSGIKSMHYILAVGKIDDSQAATMLQTTINGFQTTKPSWTEITFPAGVVATSEITRTVTFDGTQLYNTYPFAYYYIRVEDYAGNVTCVRTVDVMPRTKWGTGTVG